MHPETGRKSLLDDLVAFACRLPRVHHHRWTPGEMVAWDRYLLHQATPWDMSEPRVRWHSRIAGNPVSEAALT